MNDDFFDLEAAIRTNDLKKIAAIFNATEKSIEICSDVSNYQINIDGDIIIIEKDEPDWKVYHSIQYSELDRFAEFELEKIAMVLFAALRKEFNEFENNLFCEKQYNYPETVIKIGVTLSNLSTERCCQLHDLYAEFNDYCVDSFLKKDDKKESFFYEIETRLFKYLSFDDCILLCNFFSWMKIHVFLLSNGYTLQTGSNDKIEDWCYSNSTNEIHLLGLWGNKFQDENKDYEKVSLRYKVGSDQIIVASDKYRMCIEASFYSLIESLTYRFCDGFNCSRMIELYLSPQFELVIYNELFCGINKNVKFIVSSVPDLKQHIELYSKNALATISLSELSSRSIINKFKKLINTENTKESELQKFIATNFSLVLGKKYSKVFTEVAIPPEICGYECGRRMDILAYDEEYQEWDVFELKRADCRTTVKRRSIPSFSQEVIKGLSQAKEYRRLLSQRNVIDYIDKQYGIYVRHPKIYLVIGNQIDEAWKTCVEGEHDIYVLSYVQLASAADSLCLLE